jgi:uncharacterized OsmC-like protein
VGDAIGVQMADDRVEPVEAALLGLASCVSEAITLNCAAAGANLEGLEVKAHVDVDPGPITGAKDPSTWKESLQKVQVDVTARGEFSDRDRQAIEEGASRSPVHHIFSRTGMLQTNFAYER